MKQFLCDVCGKDADCPHLKDEIWRSMGGQPKSLLCWDCCEAKLGHMIRREELGMGSFNKMIFKFADRAKAGEF